MGEVMNIKTKNFGEITIADEKIIEFPSGIIGFPELTQFALIHDEDKGVGGIHWLQSVQEPNFAMPVMDPLLVKEDYNPEELLVLVTVTVPSDLTRMSVNLCGPIVINSLTHKAVQIIVEGEDYQVKFPIYDILKNKKKAGE